MYNGRISVRQEAASERRGERVKSLVRGVENRAVQGIDCGESYARRISLG